MTLTYDYLVLALGAAHSYFGHTEWEGLAPGLKTLEHATEIRRRILLAFEQAENEPNPAKQRAFLNFVVVGGGATGIELAGAIAEISRTVLVRDFRHINPSSARVILVEAGSRLLTAFPERLSARAQHDLEALGAEVRLNARVTAIDPDGVTLGTERIEAKTVLWAAGVEAPSLTRALGVELDRAGRIVVKEDLSIPEHPHVFVAGDLAHAVSNGEQVPGLAPAAIQMGVRAAENIIALSQGRSTKSFVYFDKGSLATIGKNRAIGQAFGLQFTGYLAWLAWLFIHIFYLVGFKNRIAVFAEWVWSYVFSKRGARLITERIPKSLN